VNDVLKMLNGNVSNSQSEFQPTFFRHFFIPESKESIDEYNKWNQYVSDCDWYKKNIQGGERSNLLF
jgi:hypothetical protein